MAKATVKRYEVTFYFYAPEDRDVNPDPQDDDDYFHDYNGKSVPKRDLKDYIFEALTTWGGQRHYADPLFHGVTPIRLKLTEVRR